MGGEKRLGEEDGGDGERKGRVVEKKKELKKGKEREVKEKRGVLSIGRREKIG